MFTRFGAVQVVSPSADVEIATSSNAPPLNRESSQVTYTCPVCGATASSGMLAPTRSGAGGVSVRGSRCSDRRRQCHRLEQIEEVEKDAIGRDDDDVSDRLVLGAGIEDDAGRLPCLPAISGA